MGYFLGLYLFYIQKLSRILLTQFGFSTKRPGCVQCLLRKILISFFIIILFIIYRKSPPKRAFPLNFLVLSNSFFEISSSFECRNSHSRNFDFLRWISWINTHSSVSFRSFECTKTLDSNFSSFFNWSDYSVYEYIYHVVRHFFSNT